MHNSLTFKEQHRRSKVCFVVAHFGSVVAESEEVAVRIYTINANNFLLQRQQIEMVL